MRLHSAFQNQHTRRGLRITRPMSLIEITDRKTCFTKWIAGDMYLAGVESLIVECGSDFDRATQHCTALMIHMSADRTNTIRGENTTQLTPHRIPYCPISDQLDIFAFNKLLQFIAHERVVIGDTRWPIGSKRAQFWRINGGVKNKMCDPNGYLGK